MDCDLSFGSDDDIMETVPPVVDVPSTSLNDIEDITSRHSSLLQDMRTVDELAEQLRVAVELRKSMEQCYSDRTANGKPPISVSVEARCLSSKSILYTMTIDNNTDSSLINWCVSLTWNAGYCNHSRTYCIPMLLPRNSIAYTIFLEPLQPEIPVLFRCDVIKVFCIRDCTRTFRIPLDTKLVSLLDFIKVYKAPVNRTAVPFILKIPQSLTYLLRGSSDFTAVDILKLVLPYCSHAINSSDRSICLETVLDANDISCPVSFNVAKVGKNFELTVLTCDNSLRNALKEAIQTFLILRVASLKKTTSIVQCFHSFKCIEDLYTGLINNYK